MDENNQIFKILSALKQGYIDRSNDNIASLSKLLFNNESQPIIIGTSNNEWCFGVEESERLFLSDWEGWGNVSIDIANAVYGNTGSYSWFYVPAGIEYCFDDNEDTYLAFMETAAEIASDNKNPLSKAGEIIWLLSHLLHSRPNGTRKYIWDMTISGILESDGYKIKIMQFSIPEVSRYTDVRIDTNKEDEEQYINECQRISDYNFQHKVEADEAIIEQLSHLFEGNKHISYVTDTVSRYIGTDGIKRNGFEHSEYMDAICSKVVNTVFPIENIIVSRNKHDFCFCGVGLFLREVTLESELNFIFSDIERYRNIDDTKEALYKLRRDLARTIKESASASQLTEPFRIEGIGKKTSENDLVIEYMQVSLPFNCILEQKTDAEKDMLS